MADAENPEQPLAGDTLAENIKRIREEQRLTYVALAEQLADAGKPIPVLGLRRIERGERRVNADELLALAYVLKVHPVNLLVPNTADETAPYGITPNVVTTAGTARDWIAGLTFLEEPETLADLAEALRWLPKDRVGELNRRWWTQERIREHNRATNRAAQDGPGVYVEGEFAPMDNQAED